MAPTSKHQISVKLTVRTISISTSLPPAPPAADSWGSSPNDGWSPAAIIGIVVSIATILVLVPLVAVVLCRYERKRCREMLPDYVSSRLGSSKSSVREDQSLRRIWVTKEVQRSSLRMVEGVNMPEEAHLHEKGWSQTEVRGGDWR